jgi:glutathione S-transferase
VRQVSATLYGMAPSHPSHSARLMLERKGIDYKYVELVPGMHAAALWPLGFRGGTVPALKLDGKRVQGSRAIARALDEAQPEPGLFPTDPELRARVEEAEGWGDDILQLLPRRLTRHIALTRSDLRVHMAGEAGVPAPGLVGPANAPIAWYFARKVDATDPDRVREVVVTMPAILDQVDSLLADGTIGRDDPNAADFQIAPSVRALMTFEDLAPVFEGRRAAEFAARLLPDYPSTIPAGFVPAEWLRELETTPTD